MGFKI